jgi:hypothetical protein
MGYVALYRAKGGATVVVKSLTPPPETRTFKVAGGIRKFKRVRYKQHLQEVLIVAKSTKAKGKGKGTTTVTDDELEDLETVDDLEDLEDEVDEDEEEDEDEDEDDEDDEPEDEDDEDDDEEEEPPTKASRKKAKSKPKQSQASKNGKVGTAEVAEAAGVDGRTLRMVLRKHSVPKDEETGRYEWSSLKAPEVKKILKWIEKGEAQDIKNEALDKLKAKKAAEKDAKAKTSKTSKKKGKKKRVVEDDDDE